MCNKQIYIFINILLFSVFNTLFAETVVFNRNEFVVDNFNQQVTTLRSDTADSRFFHNFRLPVIISQQSGLNSVPQKIEISNLVLQPVLTGLNFSGRAKNPLKVYSEYTNQPAIIAASGFSRENGILNLEFCPFVIKADTLFFVERLNYQLLDYQTPIKASNCAITQIDLLIIGSKNFAADLNRYRIFKEQSGISVQIAFVEDIVLSTDGINNAHRIRNYIKERYHSNRFRYLLLAGGTDIIPGVTFKKYADDYDAVVSDMFYSNLDKEFDSNNNGIYADYLDNIDLYPELLTGRWPASTAAELKPMVDKTIRYLSGTASSNPGYYTKLLLMAFNLQYPGDSEKYCDSIIKYSGPGLVPDRLFINSTPGISQNMVLNKLNLGANIAYAQAHGTSNKFGISGGWGVFSDQVYNFATPSGLYFIASCLPGDFSTYSMVVKALASPAGGSVNYIGVAGAEYPETSIPLHNLLAQQLSSKKTLGAALDYARRVGFPDLSFGNSCRSLYFGYNLCGDPSNYLFMQQPVNPAFSNLSTVKKGSSSLSGEIVGAITAPVRVTLWADNRIVAVSTVNSSQFTLPYQNLFADSVTLSLSSPEFLMKKITIPTASNNMELQIKNLRMIDANGSGIIESGESFKVGFSLTSHLNQPLADSMKVIFKAVPAAFSSTFTDSVMLVWPAEGVELNQELFNFPTDFSSLTADTSFTCNLQIFPSGSKNAKSQPAIFHGNFLALAANPKLEVVFARYLDGDSVLPVLKNSSAGIIDSAKISLAEPDKFTAKQNEIYHLKKIPGKALLFDSLTFTTDQAFSQHLAISQNQSSYYFSAFFQKSALNVNMADSLKLKVDNLGNKITLRWSKYPDTIAYNLFVYVNDTLQPIAPLNAQPLTRSEYEYEFSNYSAGDKIYVRIGLIDKIKRDQFSVSGFKYVNLIPQYADAPYSLLAFKLFNPISVDSKIISGTESGALLAIPADGSGFTGDGSLFVPPAYGFENDFYQGNAFGDLNNDGVKEAVYLSYPGTKDSVYLRVVNIQTGEQLAKLEVYGCCMYATPVLANIDNDTEPEILFSLFNGNNPDANTKGGYVYAFDYLNGTLQVKEGFPLISTASSYVVGAPVVTDLDKNGTRELLFSCGKNLVVYDLQSLSKLNEIILENLVIGDPVICDLNQDSKPELIVVEANKETVDGKLKMFSFSTDRVLIPYGSASGLNMSMQVYNFYKPGSAPVVADLDNDSIPEIVVVTGSKLFVFKNDGSSFSGFPVNIPFSGPYNNVNSPSMADLNGDGILDILFLDGIQNINGYSGSDAAILPGFPLVVPNSQRVHYGSLSIADLDNDGDLEIMAGGKGGKLYIFDYPTKSSTRQIYSYYRADLANTGIFSPTDEPSGIENHLQKDFSIISQYPNPFNPVTAITFNLPKANAVQFKVFNTRGQLVYQQKKNYVVSGVKQLIFNGTDLSSGLYIYSISYGKQTITGKCALLK